MEVTYKKKDTLFVMDLAAEKREELLSLRCSRSIFHVLPHQTSSNTDTTETRLMHVWLMIVQMNQASEQKILR